MSQTAHNNSLVCPACQARFRVSGRLVQLSPLRRALLAKIEEKPQGIAYAELYPLLPYATDPYNTLKVHMSAIRKALKLEDMALAMHRGGWRNRDNGRVQLVRLADEQRAAA